MRPAAQYTRKRMSIMNGPLVDVSRHDRYEPRREQYSMLSACGRGPQCRRKRAFGSPLRKSAKGPRRRAPFRTVALLL